MWLFLWVIFVLGAIGFFLWSYQQIFEQKRGWKQYADKMGLQYVGGPMLQSPTMTGEVKGRLVNFYPQITENATGQKTVKTVVEVFLNQVPEVPMVVASSGFSDFVAAVDLPSPFHVEDGAWPKAVIARTFEEDEAVTYFIEDKKKIEAIADFIKLPFDTTYVCDQEQAFLAVRTVNPISDPRKINQLISKLDKLAAQLEAAQSAPIINPNDEKETSEPETSESKE